MPTNTETIVNNCLQHLHDTNPFDLRLKLSHLGDRAFKGLRYPTLYSQPSERAKIVSDIESYLLAHMFVAKLSDGQLQLTEEGRNLKKAGDLREYFIRLWWRKNWKIILAIITAGTAIAKLFLSR